jgi:hypothetical protein
MASSLDRTFDLTIKVRITTMCGWEPDSEDVQRWLDEGYVLELVEVEKVQEVKQV